MFLNQLTVSSPGAHNYKRLAGSLAALAFCLVAPGTRAQVVAFNFGGTLTTVGDEASYLPDAIQSGQSFTGTVTYNSSHVTDSDGTIGNGIYEFSGSAQGDFSLVLNVITPSHVYSFSSIAAPALLKNVINVQTGSHLDYTAADVIMDGAALPPVSNGSRLTLSFSSLNTPVLTTDSLPSTAPSLSDFGSRNLFFEGQESGGVTVYGFEGTIDSITPVPEPATAAACAGLGLLVFGIMRRGIRNR